MELSRTVTGNLVTIDRFVDHVSTVPAIQGQPAELFVREKIHQTALDTKSAAREAVLMVHGGYWPGTMAFDFVHKDYSWMAALAGAGFDVFAMDMTGYGYSTRPLMDDPRNLGAEDQALLVPDTLPDAAGSRHPHNLVTSDSETDDIDRVVDFIRDLRGVDRVNLIGWSGGGIRTGTYSLRHPEKVARLVIFASSNFAADNPGAPPENLPGPGVAMTIQTRAVGNDVRWTPNVRCDGQVEDGMMDLIWPASMATDAVGAGWGPGCLRAPGRTYWGWNAENAATLETPTLVMVGEYDRLYDSNVELFGYLGAADKAFLGIECASHFMAWEMQRYVLHRASAEWLSSGTLTGKSTGTYWADASGKIAAKEI